MFVGNIPLLDVMMSTDTEVFIDGVLFGVLVGTETVTLSQSNILLSFILTVLFTWSSKINRLKLSEISCAIAPIPRHESDSAEDIIRLRTCITAVWSAVLSQSNAECDATDC